MGSVSKCTKNPCCGDPVYCTELDSWREASHPAPDHHLRVEENVSGDWRTLASGITDLDRLIKLCGILDAADHRHPFRSRTRDALREMALHLGRLQDFEARATTTETRIAELEADSARLSWLEANSNVEIRYEGWEDDVWEAYRVSGGRSDREWTEVARAADLRSTIDAARSALASSNKPVEERR